MTTTQILVWGILKCCLTPAGLPTHLTLYASRVPVVTAPLNQNVPVEEIRHPVGEPPSVTHPFLRPASPMGQPKDLRVYPFLAPTNPVTKSAEEFRQLEPMPPSLCRRNDSFPVFGSGEDAASGFSLGPVLRTGHAPGPHRKKFASFHGCSTPRLVLLAHSRKCDAESFVNLTVKRNQPLFLLLTGHSL